MPFSRRIEREGHEKQDDDLDHSLIVGFGYAIELEPGTAPCTQGAKVMIEWDAIENSLEVEVGGYVLTG